MSPRPPTCFGPSWVLIRPRHCGALHAPQSPIRPGVPPRAVAKALLDAGLAPVDAGAVDAGMECLRRSVAEAERAGDSRLLGPPWSSWAVRSSSRCAATTMKPLQEYRGFIVVAGEGSHVRASCHSGLTRCEIEALSSPLTSKSAWQVLRVECQRPDVRPRRHAGPRRRRWPDLCGVGTTKPRTRCIGEWRESP